MAALDGTIYTSEYRPCIVDGKKALFHRWEEKAEIREALMIGTVSGQLKTTVAIIEYEDGRVEEATLNKVQFCDNKFKDYAFDDEKQTNSLKHCPFCGGMVTIEANSTEDEEYYMVQCYHCGAAVCFGDESETIDGATEAWNRRSNK